MRQQHYRRIQILAVAAGVLCFLGSLIGGAIESRILARMGLFGFALALATVIGVGIAAGRRLD
jgi:hypothetical protein